MKYPIRRTANISEYARGYAKAVEAGWKSLDLAALEKAEAVLCDAYEQGRRVYACGNGGSAAISNHLVCDHSKGTATDTELLPGVISLSSNVEMITAIANDISFDDIFAFQLQRLANPGDILVAVSSSGNSPNILSALSWAKAHRVVSIALCGFTGGRAREVSDIPLYVDAQNYGVVEDVHQGLMHVLAQYIRQKHMRVEISSSHSF